jgi:plastocyanin
MIMRMRKPGKRVMLVAALACAGALAFASSAHAITISAPPNAEADNYDPESYTINQGGTIGFNNADPGVDHDVRARGQIGGGPLFLTPTITGLADTLVQGTEYLTAGSYAFFCNVHPLSMTGTLNVTGMGTPVPRPKVDVKVLSGDIDKVANKRKARVRVKAITDADNVSLALKLKNLRLGGKGNIDLDAGQTRTVVLRLSRRAKNKLSDKERARVKLVGSVQFGANDTAFKLLR